MPRVKVNYQKDTSRIRKKINMDGIWKEVKNTKPEEKNYTSFDLGSLYSVNTEAFLSKFDSIDTMNDTEFTALVANTHLSVLESITQIKTKDANINIALYSKLMSLFNNARYISCLTSVIKMNGIDYNHKVYLNRIIYDYFTSTVVKKDAIIERLMLELSSIANADVVSPLLSFGIDRELACRIGICRYSSENEDICIKRINFLLFSVGSEVLTIQTIVNIYQCTYAAEMTKLFESTMFDVYDPIDLRQATPSQREAYSMISTAVLEMVNQMPTPYIAVVLRAYLQDKMYGNKLSRFDIYSLSVDYSRILNVLNSAELS